MGRPKRQTALEKLLEVKFSSQSLSKTWLTKMSIEAQAEFDGIAKAYNSGELPQWPSRVEFAKYLQADPQNILSEELRSTLNTRSVQTVCVGMRNAGTNADSTGEGA